MNAAVTHEAVLDQAWETVIGLRGIAISLSRNDVVDPCVAALIRRALTAAEARYRAALEAVERASSS